MLCKFVVIDGTKQCHLNLLCQAMNFLNAPCTALNVAVVCGWDVTYRQRMAIQLNLQPHCSL